MPVAIVKTPGFCRGQARIEGTRITVKLIQSWIRYGLTDSELLDYYPHLTQEQLNAVRLFIETQLGGNE